MPEYLARREGDVQEEDDARLPLLLRLLFAVAEDLRQQHQVVVVDPHDAVAVFSLPGPPKGTHVSRE